MSTRPPPPSPSWVAPPLTKSPLHCCTPRPPQKPLQLRVRHAGGTAILPNLLPKSTLSDLLEKIKVPLKAEVSSLSFRGDDMRPVSPTTPPPHLTTSNPCHVPTTSPPRALATFPHLPTSPPCRLTTLLVHPVGDAGGRRPAAGGRAPADHDGGEEPTPKQTTIGRLAPLCKFYHSTKII